VVITDSPAIASNNVIFDRDLLFRITEPSMDAIPSRALRCGIDTALLFASIGGDAA
jgi:hypothetical protein